MHNYMILIRLTLFLLIKMFQEMYRRQTKLRDRETVDM